MKHKELYSGFVRLHILHHAVNEPIFGLGIMAELARHGYEISAGTLYPILHGLEKKGYLRSTQRQSGKNVRRMYRATALGKEAVKEAKYKVEELIGDYLKSEP